MNPSQENKRNIAMTLEPCENGRNYEIQVSEDLADWEAFTNLQGIRIGEEIDRIDTEAPDLRPLLSC